MVGEMGNTGEREWLGRCVIQARENGWGDGQNRRERMVGDMGNTGEREWLGRWAKQAREKVGMNFLGRMI